jgi:Response regulator containing CheY-like receiver domain and AraC-type DNA-binding domain
MPWRRCSARQSERRRNRAPDRHESPHAGAQAVLGGLTFSEIAEQLKSDLARHYLRDTDLPISQIAWLLGYSEVSAFTHAFKRWTGMTPRQSRAQGHRVATAGAAKIRHRRRSPSGR